VNCVSTNISAVRVEVSRTPCTVLSASLMQIVCVLGAQRSTHAHTHARMHARTHARTHAKRTNLRSTASIYPSTEQVDLIVPQSYLTCPQVQTQPNINALTPGHTYAHQVHRLQFFISAWRAWNPSEAVVQGVCMDKEPQRLPNQQARNSKKLPCMSIRADNRI
jgi:hypothetical protein